MQLYRNRMAEEMESRKRGLKELIVKLEKDATKHRKGSIHVKTNHGYTQFYLRTDAKERTGKYLKKADAKTIREYMQKKYNLEMLSTARVELEQINEFLRGYCPGQLTAPYETLPDKARSFVKPYECSDEQWIQQIMNTKYEPLDFREDAAEIYANDGTRVRSKSEAAIIDMLNKNHIPFLYERPLELNGYTIHPDFTILNVRTRTLIYWEHFGMMDDFSYVRSAAKKIIDYQEEGCIPGINLFYTFETAGKPLNILKIEKELLAILER